MRKLNARQLAREKSLFRYSSALERADFDTVAAVLQEAERDPLLAQMLTEINMVYESETIRLSPSLNHSSNHRQKDLLMTTIVIPTRQRTMQRWLPITLAAACVSVLFIGALLMRPIHPNGNFQAGLQSGSTTTPTTAASPTFVPTVTPANDLVAASTLPPTIVPPSTGVTAASSSICDSKDAVILSPSSNSVVAGSFNVSGIATAPNFGSYRLEVIGLGTGGNYALLADSTQPVVSVSTLGHVDLSIYPPENYGLRLTVFDATKQLQASCLVNITLARTAAVPDAVISANPVVTIVPINTFPVEAVVITPSFAYSSPAANGAVGITLTVGVVVKVDSQAQDGLWSHITLDGGKNGWVLTNVLRFDAVTLQAVAVAPSGLQTVDGTKGIVSVEQTILRAEPNADARMIRTLSHNTTLQVVGTWPDGGWVNVMLPDGTQGWLLAAEVQTEGVPQVAQPAILCLGTIGSQATSVFSRPATSGVTVGTLNPQTQVVILDVENQSGNATAWYYVQSFESNSVQGWVQGSAFTDLNYCAQPSSPPDQFTVVLPTVVPANTTPLTVIVPPETAQTLDSIPTIVPAVAQAGSSNTLEAVPAGICHLTNQTDKAVTIFAAPLTNNSNATVVGELASNGEALVLYQNYDVQSSPIGALWYLIMTTAPSNQQVTGWVSANSLTTAAGTPCAVDAMGSSGGSSVTATGVQAGSVSVAVPAQAAGETCHISNQTDQAATMFAAALTNDSNAPVVGKFPSGSWATVILSSYDQQSAPIGALWYLIKVDGDKPVIGWVSANSIGTSNACGLGDSGGVVVPTLVTPAAAGGVSIVGSTDAMATSPGICHVVNPQSESVQVFSGPSRDGNEATLVNNLPPNTPTTVLYQQRNKQTGEVWYLVLAVMDQEKQISGWVSADTVKAMDTCPPLS